MFKHDNWDCESVSMGGLWDDLVAKVNTPATKKAVQAAIDKNKQLAIDAGIKAASNAAGKVLSSVKATDPKNKAIIDTFIGNSVAAAQEGFIQKNKQNIIIAAGGLTLVAIAAVVIMKRRKKV